MIQQVFCPALLFLLCVFSFAACASNVPIYAPFDVSEIKASKGQEDLSEFSCSGAPDPVKKLLFEKFYKDKHASHIDQVAYKKYKEKFRPLSSYERKVIAWANRYVASKPSRIDYAACVIDWLDHWASGGALLGEVSANGEYIRKWTLASLALAYVQVKDDPGLDGAKKQNIEGWFHKVGSAVINDYSTRTDRRSRQNNHLYWAAWSVAITSVAVQDQVLFDWAMNKARFGVYQIQKDGTLPHEIYRKSMALHYHLFAIVPLVLLAEIGQANGYDLYNNNDGALHRLVKRSLRGIDDQSYFAKKARAEQNMKKVTGKTLLSWIEIYNARFPKRESSRIKKWQEKHRPVNYTRAGGDTTLLYGIP